MNLPKQNSKKNLKHKISDSPEKAIFFFDESRFGTHSKHGLGWFKKGSRTAVLTKLGYNLEVVFLPPYSPELNPVERLWQHIKMGF